MVFYYGISPWPNGNWLLLKGNTDTGTPSANVLGEIGRDGPTA